MRLIRKYARVHLSTAIILMFAAGGMLLINLHDQKRSALIEYFGEGAVYEVYGWPCIVHNYAYSQQGELFCAQVSGQAIAVNVAVAALILAGVAGCCEYLIRRRSDPGTRVECSATPNRL